MLSSFSHMALCRSITRMSMTSILETTYWFAPWPTHLPERWEVGPQGGSMTPGCTLSLRDIGTEKPMMAQRTLAMSLLFLFPKCSSQRCRDGGGKKGKGKTSRWKHSGRAHRCLCNRCCPTNCKLIFGLGG